DPDRWRVRARRQHRVAAPRRAPFAAVPAPLDLEAARQRLRRERARVLDHRFGAPRRGHPRSRGPDPGWPRARPPRHVAPSQRDMQSFVLIVDDEFGLAEMSAALLVEAGFEVAIAINGRLGLDVLESRAV